MSKALFEVGTDDEIIEVRVAQGDFNKIDIYMPVFYNYSLIGYTKRENLVLEKNIDFLIASTVPEHLVFDKNYTKIDVSEISFDNRQFILSGDCILQDHKMIDELIYKNVDSLSSKHADNKRNNQEDFKENVNLSSPLTFQSIIPEIKGFAAFSFSTFAPVQEQTIEPDLLYECYVIGEDLPT